MTRHANQDAIQWAYIATEVVFFYLSVLAVLLAHNFAKFYTSRKRSSATAPTAEKAWGHTTCIAVVAIVSAFAAYFVKENESDYAFVNRGLIIFFVLLPPALYGVADGFRIADKDIPRSTTYDNEW